MSEQPGALRAPHRLNTQAEQSILTTEADTLRAELVELERRLIPLLIAVQRALGKEPSVMTRARHNELK